MTRIYPDTRKLLQELKELTGIPQVKLIDQLVQKELKALKRKQ